MKTLDIVPSVTNVSIRPEMPPRMTYGRLQANMAWAMPDLLESKPNVRSFAIDYPNGDKSFAVYAPYTNRGGTTSEHISLLDYRDKDFIGYADMAFNPNETGIFGALPFVENAQTERHYRGQGLYQRRLLALGALTLSNVGESLHSSPIITSAAEKSWRALEQQGRAEKIKTSGQARWRINK